jgi:hypothetical protein
VAAAEDMQDGLDALQGDMADHQRRFRGEVTAESNRRLAVTEFEKLDRMADEEPAIAALLQPADQAPLHGPLDEVREIEGRKYRVDRTPVDDVAFRPATVDEGNTVTRAAARLELLLTKSELGSRGDGFMPEFVKGEFRFSATPCCVLSWRERTLAVMSWKIAALQPGNAPFRDPLEAMHALMLVQLLEDSNAHFGDWKKDPERRIQVG